MMKKCFVFVLAMILLLSLAACGKPVENLAPVQNSKATVDALLDAMEAAYTAYREATASADIISTAKVFNGLYREYLALAEDKPSSLGSMLTKLNRRIGRKTEIPECIYLIKAAYAGFADKASFAEAWCYYDLEENNAYIALIGIDEATYIADDIRILKTDGSVCRIDLSSVVTDRTSYVQPYGMSKELFLLNIADNADYLYFTFRLDSATATGARVSEAAGTYRQFWFTDMESFLMEEKRIG